MREKQGLWHQLGSVAIRSGQRYLLPTALNVFPPLNHENLANADFDRTKAAADRFERNELRLMVRLLLAKSLLRKDEQEERREEK
jgi:hypothetical protein